MNSQPFSRTTSATSAGAQLRALRRQAKLSQLDLALLSGISQRHLSCIETGRATPSPGTLHNVLMALEVPLEHCNSVFLASGYAPRYEATPLTSPGMEGVREAITHLLEANNPAPAIVLGSQWQVLAANASTGVLFDLVGLKPDAAEGLNLLVTLLRPGGLGDHLSNVEEIRLVAWQRATREALSNPELAELLKSLPSPHGSSTLTDALPPLVLTRLNSRHGELTFMSTFTTFGMPLDITMASLRIEHLIPADAKTWEIMTQAYGANET
ncbi:helix-turn-helix domain-containing protein [Pseudomonas sp.]|uniref:helix-turn-helix domain-containing protein n=1 Tax=Pseudomonas sp. TaxID=306 RepID=UPI002629C775|nr:helix-turn-helix domain-containing protein [Pseudomonas sp.]